MSIHVSANWKPKPCMCTVRYVGLVCLDCDGSFDDDAPERARIVAWLREQAQAYAYGFMRLPPEAKMAERIADAIERGDHELRPEAQCPCVEDERTAECDDCGGTGKLRPEAANPSREDPRRA